MKDLDNIKFLEGMLKVRIFEQKVFELFRQNLLRGAVHLCYGQEAIGIGACSALKKEDYIVTTHRSNGHCIGKGVDIKKMMAELLGKETGLCRGRGGDMHFDDHINHVICTSIVGEGIPIAVGIALAFKMKKKNSVVLCFFGDGASNQGVFHEGLNLASIWKVPLVFVCENNLYAVSVSFKTSTSVENIAERGKSYNIPAEIVDGNDVLLVNKAVNKAVERARNGGGPTLIECKTFLPKGHYIGDDGRYMDKEELDFWYKKDPIEKYKNYLIKENLLTEQKYEEIVKKIQDKTEEAVEYALKSPEPNVENIIDEVYA